MKIPIPIRLAAFVAAAAMVAGACSSSGSTTTVPATAAPAPAIELVPAAIAEIGVTTVVPAGWDAAPGTGVFRGEDGHVGFGSVPSWAAADPTALGLTLDDRQQLGDRWWDMYSGQVAGTAVLLAITTVGDTDYFAEFTMPAGRADHYRAAVATPALEAFDVDAPTASGGSLARASATVAGRKVAYAAGGAGEPTVVFEAGHGDSMIRWAAVAPPVGESARVFVYDRPGYGGSEPATTPRDAATIVAELRELLVTTGHQPPYVLVGHSLGGTVVDLFARTHPDEVSGLVLVDSRHHDYGPRCLAEGAGGCVIPEAMVDQLPPHMRAEWTAFTATEQQLASAPAPDEGLDLVVIAAGEPDADMTPAGWHLWQEAQQDYAAAVPGARHIVAEGSDHQIPTNQPGLIVDAIGELLGRIATPQEVTS